MTSYINHGAQQFITGNPSQQIVCEICGAVCSPLPPHSQIGTPIPTVHSMMISYPMPGSQSQTNPDMPVNAMVGAGVYEGYTCGQVWNSTNQGFTNTGAVQHFGCCFEHALLATFICAFEHLHSRGQHGNQLGVHRTDGSYHHEDLEAIRQILLKYM